MKFSIRALALFTISSSLRAPVVHALRGGSEHPQERALAIDPKDLTLYSGSEILQVNTWVKAQIFCESRGSRLATEAEWCSAGGAGKDAIFGGQKQGDQWAPVEGVNNWIQVGTRAEGNECKTHKDLGFGDPTWGYEEDKQPYESNYILCASHKTMFSGSETLQVNTWQRAQSFCESRGSRLATKAEWCSDGASGKDAIFGGQKQGDQWAPIGDSANEWVQVGIRGKGDECKTHKELGYGYPVWGYQEDKQPWESNYILCYSKRRPDTGGSFEPVDELISSLGAIETNSLTCSAQVSTVQAGINDRLIPPLQAIEDIRVYTEPIAKRYKALSGKKMKVLEDVVKYVPKIGKVLKLALTVVNKVGKATTSIDSKLKTMEKVTGPAKTKLEQTSAALGRFSDGMQVTSKGAGLGQQTVRLAEACSSQTSSTSDDDALVTFADSQLVFADIVEAVSYGCVSALEEVLAIIPNIDILGSLVTIVESISKVFSEIIKALEKVADAVGDVFGQAMTVLCCVSEDLTTVIESVSKVISLTDCLTGSFVNTLTAELAQLLDLDIHLEEVTLTFELPPRIEFEDFTFNEDQCMLAFTGPQALDFEPYHFTLIPSFSLKIDDFMPTETCDLSFDDVGQCRAGISCCEDSDCNSPDSPICDTRIFGGTFTCIPRKSIGEQCTYDATCASGHCLAAVYGAVGVCVECEADSDCSGVPGRPICDTTVFGGSWSCIAKKNDGDSCTYDGTCKSGNCFKPTGTGLVAGSCQCNECKTSGCGGCSSGQQCYSPGPLDSNRCNTLGSQCTADSDCSGVPGRPICDSRAGGSWSCIAKKNDGDSCTYDGTCKSGNCFKPTGTGLVAGSCQCNECTGSGCGGCPSGQECIDPVFSSNECKSIGTSSPPWCGPFNPFC